MRHHSLRRAAPALALGLLAGCAGTSPNLTSPQMQTPTLGNSMVGTRSVAGLPRGAAAEATLPELEPVKTPEGAFVAEPYLQLGDAASSDGRKASLALLWQAPTGSPVDDWSVETRLARGGEWKRIPAKLTERDIAVEGVDPHQLMRASLNGLETGELFDYRVLKGKEPVFTARARARRSGRSTQRFVVMGDIGAGSGDEKKVAYQASLARPDFVLVPGDIVYSYGRASEYRKNFWPIFNADTAAPEAGAPLLRSVPFVAAPGNHDVARTGLEKFGDALAYFYYWAQPLNGPPLTEQSPAAVPLKAEGSRASAFKTAAGPNYPRMASFSFDYGNAHWTVLDSNANVDWSDPALRAWVEKDLASAKKATWRFVAFHHPPFQSSKEHQNDQWMRVLCDLFEKYRVQVVWGGHVHNYQRTYPLKFVVEKPRDKDGRVEGKLTLDRAYDGAKKTRADGVLYVVTGGGGATLYDKQASSDGKLQPFTAKLVDDTHSLTVADIDGKKLTVRQVSADGKEIDSFTVTQ